MKTKLMYGLLLPALLIGSGCNAQPKNTKTEKVKIYGNCEMCEKRIEDAGFEKKVAEVDWNKYTKMATITFDSTKTNANAILKRIALAGHDNEKFLAPDDSYNKLPGCCKYDRSLKKPLHVDNAITVNTTEVKDTTTQNNSVTVEEVNQLTGVLNAYFELKDALVKSDAKSASAKASSLATIISSIDMNKLSTEQHAVWMSVNSEIKLLAENISKTTDLTKQRNYFSSLSEKMYLLAKVSNPETVIYFQNCPMYNDGEGANWLSMEKTIKNPYYGSMMLSCGKTKEEIKK